MIFFGNMPDSDGNAETIDVPGNLRTPSETFDFFEKRLRFPEWWGRNWDAFDDLLTKVDWMTNPVETRIVHSAIPAFKEEQDRKTYCEILLMASAWRDVFPPALNVVFPAAVRADFERILTGGAFPPFRRIRFRARYRREIRKAERFHAAQETDVLMRNDGLIPHQETKPGIEPRTGDPLIDNRLAGSEKSRIYMHFSKDEFLMLNGCLSEIHELFWYENRNGTANRFDFEKDIGLPMSETDALRDRIGSAYEEGKDRMTAWSFRFRPVELVAILNSIRKLISPQSSLLWELGIRTGFDPEEYSALSEKIRSALAGEKSQPEVSK